MTPPIRMVSVPSEPTEAMIDAFLHEEGPVGPDRVVSWSVATSMARGNVLRNLDDIFRNAYRAMLTAAPVREEGGAVDAAIDHLTKRLAKPGAFRLDDEPHLRIVLSPLATREEAPNWTARTEAAWAENNSEEAPEDNITILITKAQRDAALNSGKKLNEWIGGVLQRAVEEAPAETTDCKTCAGTGEIVTDWDAYLSPPEGAPGDHATADCPDCGGVGKVEAPAEAGEEILERLRDIHRRNPSEYAEICSIIDALRAQPQAREEVQPVAGDWQSVAMWMGFAASVIKSGEPWTGQCQREFDEAKAAFARLSSTPPVPEAEKLRVAMPDLSSVIAWLDNGCDPKHAVTELTIYKARIDGAIAALQQEGR